MSDTPKPIKIPAIRCEVCKLPYRGTPGDGSFADHACPGRDVAQAEKLTLHPRGRGKKS